MHTRVISNFYGCGVIVYKVIAKVVTHSQRTDLIELTATRRNMQCWLNLKSFWDQELDVLVYLTDPFSYFTLFQLGVEILHFAC